MLQIKGIITHNYPQSIHSVVLCQYIFLIEACGIDRVLTRNPG